jgi:TP901 family phage tail tape measure protein
VAQSVVELVIRAQADPAALRAATERIREGISAAVLEATQRAATAMQGPLARLGDQMRNLGDRLSLGLTAPLAALGGAAAKLSMDFDRTMTQIVTLTGASRDEVARLREEVLRLAGDTARGPQELAQALYFVLSSGIDASRAMEVLTASAKAAAIGLGETRVVADAVTTVINAYGQGAIDAGRATGILLAAVREGKAEADALAGAIGRVVPVAATMGVSFDQVAAALAVMTRAGLSTEEAVTALRAVFTDLLQPSREAEQTLRAVGLSGQQLRQILREQGLLALLEVLRSRFGGNAQALASVTDNVRGLVGVLNLLGQDADSVRGVFERLAQVTREELQSAFSEVEQQAFFRFTQALTKLTAELTKVGSTLAPGVEALARVISALAAAMRAVPEPVRAAAVVLLGLAAAIGPLLSIGGRLVQILGALRGAWQLLATVIGAGAIQGALRALVVLFLRIAPAVLAVGRALVQLATGPVGVAVGAVTLLATAWTRNWLGIRDVLARVAPGLVRLIEAVTSALGRGIETLKTWLGLTRQAVAAQAERPAAPAGAPAAPAVQPGPTPQQLEQQLEAVRRTQAQILEAYGQTFRARLMMIAEEERRIAQQTGNEVLAHEWANAQIVALQRERARILAALYEQTNQAITRAVQDSVTEQVLQLVFGLERQKEELRRALDDQLITWQGYSNQVAWLNRSVELEITRIFADSLEQRRQALDRFTQEYQAKLLGLVDTEREIARLRATLAGRTQEEILQAEAEVLQEGVRNERLSVEQRIRMSQELERVLQQRIQLLEREGGKGWALVNATEALRDAQSRHLQLLMQLRQEQLQSLSVAERQVAVARDALQSLAGTWTRVEDVLRTGAANAASAIAQALVDTLPRQFEAAWLQAIERVRKAMEGLDPRVRRSPSVVDLVTAGLREVEAAFKKTARQVQRISGEIRAAAAAGGPGAARPVAQLVVQGVTISPERATNLLDLLVRDPVQRYRFARAAALAG